MAPDEGKLAGTFNAKIVLREPAPNDVDEAPTPEQLRLPTGVGLERLIKEELQVELEDNGSRLLVASVHVERTDA